MDSKVIIGVVAAVIILGGGAWYLSSQPKTAPEGEQAAQGTSGTGTYATLLALGGSQECTVNVTTPESPATGTVYVSGTEIRSDVIARPANTSMEISAHMIRTGGYIYTWTDMLPQGVKIQETAAESASADAAKAGYDMSAQVQYTCKPWIPDNAKFEVPADITFMEFKAQGGANVPTMPLAAPTVN